MIQIDSDQLKLIKQNIDRDTQELVLKGVPIFVLQQIKARQKSSKKLPILSKNYDLVFPKSISVEQSSSEKTAGFKAALVEGSKGIDLTGGFGIDSIYFSMRFDEFTYNEQNNELSELFEFNCKVLGLSNLKISNKHIDVGTIFSEDYDFIFLDPSRRLNNKKVFRLEDCSPSLLEIQANLIKNTKRLMVKLSPLIDIHELKKSLNFPFNLYCLKYQNEVKELILLSSDNYQYHSVDLDNETIYSSRSKAVNIGSSSNGKYLFLPNGSMNKLELSDQYAFEISFSAISNTKAYVGDILPSEMNYGRYYTIIDNLRVSSNMLKKFIANKSFSIITKDYPLSPSEVRKRFKVKESDNKLAFIFKESKNTKLIIAERI